MKIEGDIESKITYFRYCGEANTEKVLQAVKSRATETGLYKVIIASETGKSALKALEVFEGTRIDLIVVTHYPSLTWGPRGDIPIGLKRKEYSKALKILQAKGIKVVQGTRPFAPPSRSIGWEYSTPEVLIDKTLEIFGAGTKIAVEAAVMATDAGEVNADEEVISCAGTFKGLDTALIVKCAYSGNFFKEFEVKEIIAKPINRVKVLPEYKDANWRGNLDAYYQ